MSYELEIFKQHGASRERLIQFLMASAGAAIGFCVTLQDSLQFVWPDLLIILATLLFALSFLSGDRSLRNFQHLLWVNGTYIQGAPAGVPSLVHEKAKDIVVEKVQKKHKFWSKTQLMALISGSFFLMGWRIAMGYPEFDLFSWLIEKGHA